MTTFGESHGGGVGCVIDGVPPRMHITQVCRRPAVLMRAAVPAAPERERFRCRITFRWSVCSW